MKLKRIFSAFMALFTCTSLVACGTNNPTAGNSGLSGQTVAQTEFNGSDNGNSKILIAYFSYFDNTDSQNITSKKYADAMSSASVTTLNGQKYGNNYYFTAIFT